MRSVGAVMALLAALPLSACGGGTGIVQGNDTGGIIPYAAVPPEGARELAFEHCARYAKVPKATGVDARYGGYYSFRCNWDRRLVR